VSIAVHEGGEFRLARALTAGLARLPRGAMPLAGATLGELARGPLHVRRAVVEAQIGAAFPERPASWVVGTARACYRHFGREAAEMARLWRVGSTDLAERTAGGDAALTRYRESVAPGRGAIVVTGHAGNWEMAGAFLAARGCVVAAVVKRLRNRRLDRMLEEARRAAGVRSLFAERAARSLGGVLDDGALVAMVADQDAGGRGTFVPFLGRPASTFTGPARLALTHSVPLLFGGLLRERAGYRAILEPVWLPSDGPRTAGELTARWVGRLEELVRRAPEQYFWFHRRWKTQPAVPADGPASHAYRRPLTPDRGLQGGAQG